MKKKSRFTGLPNDEALLLGRQIVLDMKAEISKVVFGPELESLTDIMIMALLADSHVVVRAPIGMAKTLACNAMAQTIGGVFNKRQFRPDMLASEISGSISYNQKTHKYETRHGPLVGANIFLADEINRATPKSQSALLEAMEERHVTVDKVYPLEPVFMVLATRNPVEHEGTYELPEAQLDRFFAQPTIEAISEDTEMRILTDPEYWRRSSHRLTKVQAVTSPAEILILHQAIFAGIHIEPRLSRYFVKLARATRTHPLVEVGSSPRGPVNLQKGAKVAAFLSGRKFAASVEDINEALFVNIMAHRLFLKPEARNNNSNKVSAADVARDVFQKTKYDHES